jgi:hypothetical protein
LCPFSQYVANARRCGGVRGDQGGQSKKFSELVSDCVATTGFGESFSAGMAGGVQPTGSFDVVLSLAAGRIASDVQELPAGEIDIILVTQAGERRAKSASRIG